MKHFFLTAFLVFCLAAVGLDAQQEIQKVEVRGSKRPTNQFVVCKPLSVDYVNLYRYWHGHDYEDNRVRIWQLQGLFPVRPCSAVSTKLRRNDWSDLKCSIQTSEAAQVLWWWWATWFWWNIILKNRSVDLGNNCCLMRLSDCTHTLS